MVKKENMETPSNQGCLEGTPANNFKRGQEY